MVLASLADQNTMRATIDQIETGKAPGGDPQVRFYPIGETAPASLTSVLQTLVPKATVTADPLHERLAVMATPEDHASIQAAIEEYQKSATGPSQRKLVLYPVSAAERQRFQAVLANLTAELPSVKIITDAEPGELAVWATPEEHKVVAEVVEQLKQPTAAEGGYTSWPIRFASPIPPAF